MMKSPSVDCILDARAAIGEGALWCHRDGVLWWVDIPRCQLHCFNPSTGRNRYWTMPSQIGCVALRRTGGVIVTLENGWHAFDPSTEVLEHWHDPEPDKVGNRFNDGATDPLGRFWAGTMPSGGVGAEPEGALHKLDVQRKSSKTIEHLWIPNGLAFSPDGRNMYLSDTHSSRQQIWIFEYDLDDGFPSNRRVFFDTKYIAGRPDGAAVDADGCYWFAAIGGWEIVRLTPKGIVDRRISVPVERPTKVAFGGPQLETLFITSMSLGVDPTSALRQPLAGGVFAVSVGVRGVACEPYSG